MNKKIIWIFVAILIIIVAGVFYFSYKQRPDEPTTPPIINPLSENMSCEEMYDEIENDLDETNYCQVDSDCDVITLGSWYVEFGCYHFVNKNVDKQQFYDKMDVYREKCSKAINKCASAPEAKCVSNKCAERRVNN